MPYFHTFHIYMTSHSLGISAPNRATATATAHPHFWLEVGLVESVQLTVAAGQRSTHAVVIQLHLTHSTVVKASCNTVEVSLPQACRHGGIGTIGRSVGLLEVLRHTSLVTGEHLPLFKTYEFDEMTKQAKNLFCQNDLLSGR